MVKLPDSGDCEGLPALTLFPSLVRICPHPLGDGRRLTGGLDVIFHGYLSSGYDVVILDAVLPARLIHAGRTLKGYANSPYFVKRIWHNLLILPSVVHLS